MSEITWHNLPSEKVLGILGVDVKTGLNEKEVRKRREYLGLNRLSDEKPLSSFKLFLSEFNNPFIYLLSIAGIITVLLKDYSNTIIIFGTVFLNTLVGFFQEKKTSKILQKLKTTVKTKAVVIREGKEKEIDQKDIVPGDIFLLKSGSKVPADARLISNYNLKVNESSLTGEWLAADKENRVLPSNTPLADRDNMVYMGCLVEDGEGSAVATATGSKTEIGKISRIIRETKQEKTPYQKKIISLSKTIGLLVVLASFLIFIIGIITKREAIEMFLTSVAIAVGATPEGLPVIITIILVLGMQKILKRQGLIRKMVAAETLGNVSVILTDKTGTLTEGKMQLKRIYTWDEEISHDGEKYSAEIDSKNNGGSFLALKIATLCSEAFIEKKGRSKKDWVVRGRATDKALLIAGAEAGFEKKLLEIEEPMVIKFPFNSIQKYSASLHRNSAENEYFLYVLGAPEMILGSSKYYYSKNKKLGLANSARENIDKEINKITMRGERVLAVAFQKYKTVRAFQDKKIQLKNLILVGLISLSDPIRKDVKEAIAICRQAGIKPIIVTGDHKLTAKAIGRELGFQTKEKNIIEGKVLEKLTRTELERKLADIEIYARVEPLQKLRIAESWQKMGKVVAMTGDGLNDTPALKKADIGIALGSGTDAAKETSDLVLLKDDFSGIISAIEEGRAIIDNIRKAITFTMAECFSEMILVMGSIFFNLPLLILPAQILWENLIEGSPQGMALGFEEKEEDIMQRLPEDPKKSLLTSEMKTIIFGFGIFTDILLFILCVILLNKGVVLAEVRTMAFAGLALCSFFYLFSCKNLRKNIWQYDIFSNFYLLLSFFAGCLLLIAAVYLPFLQKLLKTVPLVPRDWLLLIVLGLINLVLIELTKSFFIKLFRKKRLTN